MLGSGSRTTCSKVLLPDKPDRITSLDGLRNEYLDIFMGNRSHFRDLFYFYSGEYLEVVFGVISFFF